MFNAYVLSLCYYLKETALFRTNNFFVKLKFQVYGLSLDVISVNEKRETMKVIGFATIK